MQPTLFVLGGKYLENAMYDVHAFCNEKFVRSQPSLINYHKNSKLLFSSIKATAYDFARAHPLIAKRVATVVLLAARSLQSIGFAFAAMAALTMVTTPPYTLYLCGAVCITPIVTKIINLSTDKLEFIDGIASKLLAIAAAVSLCALGVFAINALYYVGAAALIYQTFSSQYSENQALNKLEGNIFLIDAEKKFNALDDNAKADDLYTISNKLTEELSPSKYESTVNSDRAKELRKKICLKQIDKFYQEIISKGFPKFQGNVIAELVGINSACLLINKMLQSMILFVQIEKSKKIEDAISYVELVSHFAEKIEPIQKMTKEFNDILKKEQTSGSNDFCRKVIPNIILFASKAKGHEDSQPGATLNAAILRKKVSEVDEIRGFLNQCYSCVNLFDPLKRSNLTKPLLSDCHAYNSILQIMAFPSTETLKVVEGSSKFISVDYIEFKRYFPNFAIPDESFLRKIEEGVNLFKSSLPALPPNPAA